jgi:hypothetical protein
MGLATINGDGSGWKWMAWMELANDHFIYADTARQYKWQMLLWLFMVPLWRYICG